MKVFVRGGNLDPPSSLEDRFPLMMRAGAVGSYISRQTAGFSR